MSAEARRLGCGLVALAWLLAGTCARAQADRAEDRIDAAVAEASTAFALPPGWIEAVIATESGGDPWAVSRKGAMGLMQLMPATWRELRGRLGLGADPFDVRDNVFAGAAYLREMFDRFGAPGFLAAYNAGPGRYAQALAGRAALPEETRRYLAVLAPSIGQRRRDPVRSSLAPSGDGLFPLARRLPAGGITALTPAAHAGI